MKLLKDTPEVDNWVVDLINTSEVKLFSLEGYSVKDEKVTAIFDRRRADEDVNKIPNSELSAELSKDVSEWEIKKTFAGKLNVPFYITIWEEGVDKYLLVEILNNHKFKIKNVFSDGKSFAVWLKNLKGIKVKKDFIENKRLASIDNILRQHNVPWPGNLDGFIYINGKIECIIEFSRTRKTKVNDHDVRKFFKKDVNRWKPFEILRNQLKVPAYLILWSSSEEDLVKIQKIKEITDNLYFEKEELLKKEEIIGFFQII